MENRRNGYALVEEYPAMCGRFVQVSAVNALHPLLTYAVPLELFPNYNLAPTQRAVVIREHADNREGVLMRWGLIPSWAKDKKIAQINARADTVATKPMFRSSFKKRRCIIPADGYFEWKTVGGQKYPYLHRMRDGSPLIFAGLWERWEGEDEPLESFALITTDANATASQVHNRMPVVLRMDSWEPWLDSDTDSSTLTSLLVPMAGDGLEVFPVSVAVNSPKNNRPELIEPRISSAFATLSNI
jgi:putative SOS response-associated peptidase YedK